MTGPGRRSGPRSGADSGAEPRPGSGAGTGCGPAPGDAEERVRPTSGRVVISSVTGKPITWDGDHEDGPSTSATERRPILPDRVREDEPAPGVDESNDARIAGETPPHWGRGR